MTIKNLSSLEKGLSGVEKGQIVLLETRAEKINDLSLAVMKMIAKKKATVIFLTANRPCTTLLALYDKNNISTERLLIIDCICKTIPASVKASSNVIHIGNASALTSISLVITESLKKISGPKVVIMDSINSLLIHNQATTFSQFIHSLLTKIRLLNTGGIFLSLEAETDKVVRAEIVQLCDNLVKG